jgi:DNA (cytosine-5)-methyltransferase 1
MVEELDPDAFLFENVTGLLNMEGGAVFREILQALGKLAAEIHWWKIPADEYGVPQRRTRVIIAGFRRLPSFRFPPPLVGGGLMGVQPVSVIEALDDLPAIAQGEDGSNLPYKSVPSTDYQRLMRGDLDPTEYQQRLLNRRNSEIDVAGKSWASTGSTTRRGLRQSRPVQPALALE